MSNEQVAPETKGVAVKMLTTIDLGPEIEGMAGRQLRMRMVTIAPGGVSARFTIIKTDPGPSTSCKERSPTIEMVWIRTMGRAWAGPRTETPCTGWRTGERFRRWKSRSISSARTRRFVQRGFAKQPTIEPGIENRREGASLRTRPMRGDDARQGGNLLPGMQMASRPRRPMGLRPLLRNGMEHVLDARRLPWLHLQMAKNPMPLLRQIFPARGVVPLPAGAGDFGFAIGDIHLGSVGWVREATHR